ncbi:acyltransferase [Tenacibaculum sp.]|nr:acyltransferase [Tenacibaculum sp.]
MIQKQRRYDLDWLRVIAIFAVYFHHIGMPFNGDGFHIMNSESSKILDDIMVFFEQFRLPLLFLISGIGTMFAFSKRTWFQFLKERSTRLLIPLIFGILFIVPPQTYYENIKSYLSYYEVYQNIDLEINHLWFIKNLFILSILLIPLILFLRSNKAIKIIKWFEYTISLKYGLFLWSLPLIIITIILKKFHPNNSKDLSNLANTFYYGYFFIFGILFTASKNSWTNLKSFRKPNLYIFIISTLLFYSYYFIPNSYISPFLSINNRWNVWYIVSSLVGWSFVITLLGYSQVLFKKNSLLLQKLNEGIYPFYILHQTIIIVLGYYIIQINTNIPFKIILLTLSSLPLILVIYRFLIYPFKIPRMLFGMKKSKVE